MNSSNGGGGSNPPEEEGAPRPHGKHDHYKSITMADIARSAGVSQGAISSLLNDRDYGIRVSEKTRDRVFKACRDLGYIPNDLRAVVRMYPEQGELVVMASSEFAKGLTDPFFSRVVKGVADAMSDPSRAVTIARFDSDTDYNTHPDGAPHPVRWGTASKFICVGKPNLSLFQAIIRRGFPAICVGHEATLPGVTSILPDYAAASRTAIEYLFGLGHARIAILSGPFGTTDQLVIEMNRGVRIAYDQAGVPIEAQNIVYGDLTFQNGYRSLDTLLNRKPVPTAILCLNDSSAAGVIARAMSLGIRVPDELSVLGCADDSFSECIHPALSTVHLPAEEIGSAAVLEIERRVQLKEEGLLEMPKMVLPVRLVERSSCAAPKAKAKA